MTFLKLFNSYVVSSFFISLFLFASFGMESKRKKVKAVFFFSNSEPISGRNKKEKENAICNIILLLMLHCT